MLSVNSRLTSCAALLCRALRRVNRLCSRTVSGTANRLKKHGRRNPLPFPFSQRSHVGNLRQTIQGKGVIHKRVETAGVYPLVRPRGVSANPPPRGAARSRRRGRRTPAEVQRKTHRPLGANCLRGSCAPDNRCRKRCCPDRAYCCATRVPSIVCAGKEAQLLLLRKKSALFLAKERQK